MKPQVQAKPNSSKKALGAVFSMPDLSKMEKEIKSQAEAAENQVVELNYENLKKCWDEFCVAKRSKGLSDEFVTLSNALIELKPESPETIFVQYDYQDTFDHFNKIKTDFLKQLGRKLRKPEIQFQVSLRDRSNEKKKMFTDDDKFKYIAQKYPELNDLQNRLGLDFEY